jgi:hypothetical protein
MLAKPCIYFIHPPDFQSYGMHLNAEAIHLGCIAYFILLQIASFMTTKSSSIHELAHCTKIRYVRSGDLEKKAQLTFYSQNSKNRTQLQAAKRLL